MEQVEFEIKNTLTLPKMKYLGINLTKYVHDLYEENYKTDEKYQRRSNKWAPNYEKTLKQ
jgi:hypothetical protein